VSLEELDRPNAAAWRPAPDEKIVGKVTAIDVYDGGHGPYPIITVERVDNGELAAIHSFHTVLRNEFAKARPRIGDVVGVLYLGKKIGASGVSYQGYRVAVAGKEPPPMDWSQFDDGAPPPDAPGPPAAPATDVPADDTDLPW
jgi:hypothetical protein